jgi:hypothetical protein
MTSEALTSTLTREVRAMDPELPVFSVKTMEEYISSSVAAPPATLLCFPSLRPWRRWC